MRIKYNFLLLLLIFLTAILTVSSFSIFYYFKQNILEGVDSSISNWAEALYDRATAAPYLFLRSPGNYVLHPRSREYPANAIVVYVADRNGKVLAVSGELTGLELPIANGKDGVFHEIQANRNKTYRAYQLALKYRENIYGYIVTAVPIYGYYQVIGRFGVFLFLMTIATIVILGYGIYSITLMNILANQKKFLGFASHELRIPLSVIMGNLELLLRERKNIPKKYLVMIEVIKQKSEWMHKLIGNLLLLFRTEALSEKIHKTHFDLGDLLVEECSQLKTRYPQKNVMTRIIPQRSKICADIDHIRKLIANLLDNAAKYTGSRGKIRIELTSVPEGYHLKISDNGVGIRKELLGKIFEPYFRINPRGQDGVGLGLAICRWIVRSHKGILKVVSQPDQGTTFTIFLPTGIVPC